MPSKSAATSAVSVASACVSSAPRLSAGALAAAFGAAAGAASDAAAGAAPFSLSAAVFDFAAAGFCLVFSTAAGFAAAVALSCAAASAGAAKTRLMIMSMLPNSLCIFCIAVMCYVFYSVMSVFTQGNSCLVCSPGMDESSLCQVSQYEVHWYAEICETRFALVLAGLPLRHSPEHPQCFGVEQRVCLMHHLQL